MSDDEMAREWVEYVEHVEGDDRGRTILSAEAQASLQAVERAMSALDTLRAQIGEGDEAVAVAAAEVEQAEAAERELADIAADAFTGAISEEEAATDARGRAAYVRPLSNSTERSGLKGGMPRRAN